MSTLELTQNTGSMLLFFGREFFSLILKDHYLNVKFKKKKKKVEVQEDKTV